MKYLVKKEFADMYGSYCDRGETWEPFEDSAFIEGLLQHGFIEELKEDKRWRADTDEMYWYIHEAAEPRWSTESSDYGDAGRHRYGNYFKSQETAELVEEALKLFFEYLHTAPGTPQQNIKNDFEHAHSEARKAVIQDNKMN